MIGMAAALMLGTSGCTTRLFGGDCSIQARACTEFDLLLWCDTQEACTSTLDVTHRIGGDASPLTWTFEGGGQLESRGAHLWAGVEALNKISVTTGCAPDQPDCVRVGVLADGSPLTCSLGDPLSHEMHCELPRTFETLTLVVAESTLDLTVILTESVCLDRQNCEL
jgi:hypothetical protein